MTFKKKIIVGNWKMNKSVAETQQYIAKLSKVLHGQSHSVFLAVPFTDLAPAVASAKGHKLLLVLKISTSTPQGLIQERFLHRWSRNPERSSSS